MPEHAIGAYYKTAGNMDNHGVIRKGQGKNDTFFTWVWGLDTGYVFAPLLLVMGQERTD